MTYVYLLIAGTVVSMAHFYLVWRHRDNRRYSISEHAMLDRQSRVIYFVAHLVCAIFFLLFSYQFFIVEQELRLPHYLNISFVIFDIVQAALPSRGKTEKMHFMSAYISWISYLLSGLLALAFLQVTHPFKAIAFALLVPILGMFIYMHINRTKLYPYQLLIVPLFVVYLLMVVLGS